MNDLRREKELVKMYYSKKLNLAEVMKIANRENLHKGYIHRTIFFD